MITVNSNYRVPILCALALHVVLLIFLLVHFKLMPDRPVVAASSENIIQAVAVSQSQPVQSAESLPKPKPETAVVEPVQKKEVVQKQPPKKVVIDQKSLVDQELQKEITEQKKQTQVKQQLAAKKAAEQVAKELMQKELADLNASTKAPATAVETAVSAQAQGEIDKYKALIIQAISQQWIMPEDSKKGLEAKLVVQVAPGGMVVDVKIVQASGDPVLDRSAQTAIYKASPLPVPQDSAIFDKFRTINLTVRPEGIIANG